MLVLFNAYHPGMKFWNSSATSSRRKFHRLEMNSDHHSIHIDVENKARFLADQAGLGKAISLTPLSGGRNNRVFRLQVDGASYLLKSYFRHDQDTRDRLGTEYTFTSFCWRHGVYNAPRPIACDRSLSCGLYEYVDGRRPYPGEISDDLVDQALRFYLDLNKRKLAPEARNLPAASEACFRIRDHLVCVDRRLERLAAIESGDLNAESDATTQAGMDFIREELMQQWRLVKQAALDGAGQCEKTAESIIPFNDRCLSPSDFGFHNAILQQDGTLRFIDFEYAGWDDPAKMVCDFFCQPEVPVAAKHLSSFQEGVLSESKAPHLLHHRIKLLFPVYRIKWCCIILNDFLPDGGERRGFANPSDREARKKEQLNKARSYFARFFKQDSCTKG